MLIVRLFRKFLGERNERFLSSFSIKIGVYDYAVTLLSILIYIMTYDGLYRFERFALVAYERSGVVAAYIKANFVVLDFSFDIDVRAR